VYPNYFEVDDEENIIGEVILKPIEEINLFDMPAHGACTMFRTKVLRMLGGYIEDYSCQDGYELWLRFIQNHSPGNIPDKLFYYRQHPSSLSKNREKILKTRMKIKEDFIKRNTDGLIPKVTAIVLASNQNSMEQKHPLFPLCGKPLIHYTLNELKKTKNIENIIVSSECKDILKYSIDSISSAIPHNRKIDGSCNLTRREEYFFAIQKYIKTHCPEVKSDYFCILNVNSPLRTAEHIDWAINTIKIFDLDGLISVDEELNNLYKHTSNGLKEFETNEDKIKIERDPIFKENGALTIFRSSLNYNRSFEKKSKVGHICLLPHESVRINSQYEHWLAEKIIESR
jgi:CMP-N-acetylneuraminic acid synthetase